MFSREAIVESIQPEGLRSPIVGIHGLGLDQRFYRPLAKRLGPDQPVYGLWSETEEAGTPDHFEVVETACCYADEIDRLIPTGAFTLAAVSAASVVAFDLAQQLTARGRDVALLVLFDAQGPHVSQVGLSPRDRATVHYRELRKAPVAYLEGRARMMRAHALRQVGLAKLSVRRRLGRPMDSDMMKFAFVERNVSLADIYDYQPYSGRMLIIKGGDDAFTLPLAERGMGWANLVDGDRLEVAVVPGGHLSLLAEPHVELLAKVLADAHAEACAQIAGDTSAWPPRPGGNRSTEDEGYINYEHE